MGNFFQDIIDAVTGRAHALNQKRNAEHQLHTQVREYQEFQLREIERQVNYRLQRLDELDADSRREIENLTSLHYKIKQVVSAIWLCANNDTKKLEEILKKPYERFCYFEAINYRPLHILIALYVNKGIDVSQAILKIIKYQGVDYLGSYHGVIPVKAMLADPKLRNATLERMLNDIVVAIENNNFDLACKLIDYDREYFKKAKVDKIPNGDILLYTIYRASNSVPPDLALDFIRKLITHYQFDDIYSIYKIPSPRLINHAKQVIDSCDKIPPNYNKAYLDATIKYWIPDYAVGVVPDYANNFKYNAFFKNLRMLAVTEGRLSNYQLLGFNFSSDAKRVVISGLEIDYLCALFITRRIYPHFEKISFINCKFIEQPSALGIIFSYLAQHSDNVPKKIEYLTISNCKITDYNHPQLFAAMRHATQLKKVVLEKNLFTSEIIKTLNSFAFSGSEQSFLQHCRVEISDIVGVIDTKYFHELHSNMKKAGALDHIFFKNITLEVMVFDHLFQLLRNDSQITSIYLEGMHLSSAMVWYILQIIKASPKLTKVSILNCRLDSKASALIPSLANDELKWVKEIKVTDCIVNEPNSCSNIKDIRINRAPFFKFKSLSFPLIDLVNDLIDKTVDLIANSDDLIAKAKTVDLIDFFQSLEKSPPVELPEWKQYQIGLFEQALSVDSLRNYTHVNYSNELNFNINAQEYVLLQETLQKCHKERPLPSNGLCAARAKVSIKYKAKDVANKFWDNYIADLRKIEPKHWMGSRADLPLIAELLGCRIHLHQDNVGLEYQTYGSQEWTADIHIIQKGHAFYGYSQELQTIISNELDNLNLFRACIQAITDISHNLPSDEMREQMARALQIHTFKSLPRARECVEAEYVKILNLYLDAKNEAEIIAASCDLPMISLLATQQIISFRNMASALDQLDTLSYHKFKISQETNCDQLLDALQVLFDSQQANPRKFNLNTYVGHGFDFAKNSLQDFFVDFYSVYQKRIDKLQDALAIAQEQQKFAKAETAHLLKLKEDAIVELQEKVEQMLHDGQLAIDNQYDDARQQGLNELLRTGVCFFATGLGMNLFGPALEGVLGSTLRLTDINAQIAAAAIVKTSISYVVNGGKAEDLPSNMLKSFVASKFAVSCTEVFFKDGLHIYNLEDKAADKFTSYAVQIMHKSIENSSAALMNGKNPLRELAVSVPAATIAAVALGSNASNHYEFTIGMEVTTAAAREAITGASSEQIISAAVLKWAETSANNLGKKTANDLKAQLEPQSNVTAKPAQQEESASNVPPPSSSNVPPSEAQTNSDAATTVLPPLLPQNNPAQTTSRNSQSSEESSYRGRRYSHRVEAENEQLYFKPAVIFNNRSRQSTINDWYDFQIYRHEQNTSSPSIGQKVMDFFISPANGQSKSPYLQYLHQAKMHEATYNWLMGQGNLDHLVFGAYQRPSPNMRYYWTPEYAHSVLPEYGARKIYSYSQTDNSFSSKGLNFEELGGYQETELYERRRTLVEFNLLAGASKEFGGFFVDASINAVKLLYSPIAISAEFNAVNNPDYPSLVTDYERAQLDQSYQNIKDTIALPGKAYQSIKSITLKDVGNFIGNTSQTLLYSIKNLDESNAEATGRLWAKTAINTYLVSTGVRAGYGITKTAASLGEQAYLIGTMGIPKGKSISILNKHLNSTPIVNSFKDELFTRLNPHKRVLLFSEEYAQGNKANLACGGRKTTINDIKKNSGGRELSIRENTALDLMAEEMYESIRQSKSDIGIISKNTGMSEYRIQKIKEHLFSNEHVFKDGTIKKFDPDALIFEAWKNLEEGVHTKRDLAILNHELFELKFEGIFKTDYHTAHNAANRAGYYSGLEGLTNEQLQERYFGILRRFKKD